jgi:hypothetical protein
LFTIQDGRSKFYQWDKGRKLIVKDSTISEVHFSNGVVGCALVCETYTEDGKTFANVPNILLTSDLPVAVYAYSADYTKHSARFKVHPRPKPADYVYTETEIWTAEKAVAAALEEAKANGDFKGDKGEKGDAGAIKFIVVAELPAEGEDGAIYLLPSADGADQNAYDEFIFNAGEWEKIGSASVAVDLTDYVKNTDYAGNGNYGVITTHGNYGVDTNANGLLVIMQALEGDIANKTSNFRPITPNKLDYAVKRGLCDSRLAGTGYAWTDDEKAAARELLGAVGTTDYASLDKTGVVKVSNYRGMRVLTGGIIAPLAPTEEYIDNRNNGGDVANTFAVTLNRFDYAFQKALEANAYIADLEARIAALEAKAGAV